MLERASMLAPAVGLFLFIKDKELNLNRNVDENPYFTCFIESL